MSTNGSDEGKWNIRTKLKAAFFGFVFLIPVLEYSDLKPSRLWGWASRVDLSSLLTNERVALAALVIIIVCLIIYIFWLKRSHNRQSKAESINSLASESSGTPEQEASSTVNLPLDTATDEIGTLNQEIEIFNRLSKKLQEIDRLIVNLHLSMLIQDEPRMSRTMATQLCLSSLRELLQETARSGLISVSLLESVSIKRRRLFKVIDHSGLVDKSNGSWVTPLTLKNSTAGESCKTGRPVLIDDTKNPGRHIWHPGSHGTNWCFPFMATYLVSRGGKKELTFSHVLCVTSTIPHDLIAEDVKLIEMFRNKIQLIVLSPESSVK